MALPGEVTFVYTQAADYRQVPANGVFGGLTSRGEVRLEFFLEAVKAPEKVTHRLGLDGKIGEEVSRAPNEVVVERRLQVGVIMTREQAKLMLQWLSEKLDKAEALGAAPSESQPS